MKKSIVLLWLLIVMLASGCNIPAAATPTPEPTITPTITTTSTAVPPTATITFTPVPSATTILETFTPAPTITTVPTRPPCVYAATVVDESPSTDQEFAVNATFTKTWTLKNTGTCAWDGTSWKLHAANAAGDTQLDSEHNDPYRIDVYSNPKKNVIIVGDTTTLTLNMQAPDHWGTFTQNWLLIDSDTNKIMSINYGDGTSTQSIYARIVVSDSGSGGSGGGEKPTVEIQTITLQAGTTACTSDARYNITAKIIGTAKSKVSYTVSADNGAVTNAGESATLNNKGGYDINTAIADPYADSGNVNVTITVFSDGVAANYASASICVDGAYQP